MKTIFLSLAMMACAGAYSQTYCKVDRFGYPVNPKSIPVEDSSFALAALAETFCCCNLEWKIGTSASVAGTFRVYGDSLKFHINETSNVGQTITGTLDSLNLYGGYVRLIQHANENIWRFLYVKAGSVIDQGTWRNMSISIADQNGIVSGSGRAFCFTFQPHQQFNEDNSGYIPLAGTLIGAPVTGPIEIGGISQCYMTPLASGVHWYTQLAADYSAYELTNNHHEWNTSGLLAAASINYCDSIYRLSTNHPDYDVQFETNDYLLDCDGDMIIKTVENGRKHENTHTTGANDMKLSASANPSVFSQHLLYWNGLDYDAMTRAVNGSNYTQSRYTPSLLTTTAISGSSSTNVITGPTGHSETVLASTLGSSQILLGGVASLSASDALTSETTTITLAPNQATISGTGVFPGAMYASDYSPNFLPLSLVTKDYVDNQVSGYIPLSGTVPGDSITGDLEFDGTQIRKIYSDCGTIHREIIFDDECGLQMKVYEDGLMSSMVQVSGAQITLNSNDLTTGYGTELVITPGNISTNSNNPSEEGFTYNSTPANTDPLTMVWRQWVEDRTEAWQGVGAPSTPGDYNGRHYHDTGTIPYGIYEYTAGGWVQL